MASWIQWIGSGGNLSAVLVDLSGLIVADIGAGTGRATRRLARKAKQVFAIDAYRSVLDFSRRLTESAGVKHVTYLLDDRGRISLPDNAVDATIAAVLLHHLPEKRMVVMPATVVANGCPVSIVEVSQMAEKFFQGKKGSEGYKKAQKDFTTSLMNHPQTALYRDYGTQSIPSISARSAVSRKNFTLGRSSLGHAA